MRLIGSERSPYVRKVMLVAHELGLADRIERENISVAIRKLERDPINPNPFGQIPTLVTDDGRIVHDSFVICDYLASLADAAWLLNGTAGRLDILTRHATAHSMLDLLLKRLVERNRTNGVENELCGAFRTKVGWGLDALETNAGGWMQMPVELGQLTVACALAYIDFRFEADGWRQGRPSLAAWYENMRERPSMRATTFKA